MAAVEKSHLSDAQRSGCLACKAIEELIADVHPVCERGEPLAHFRTGNVASACLVVGRIALAYKVHHVVAGIGTALPVNDTGVARLTIFIKAESVKFFYHLALHHVVIKTAVFGRTGILGSHIDFGDLRRGWNFRSLGHGDVNFEEIIRVLNAYNYDGPLSVEWEDSGMDRIAGAREAAEFVRKVDFAKSDVKFDAAIAN